MGLFSKRRSAGFDPELWSDADERAAGRGTDSWFDDLGRHDATLEELSTNTVGRFEESDEAWLADDPGERVRNQR